MRGSSAVPRVLDGLQRGIERMYRIDHAVSVGDFVVDAAARERMGVSRAPREQLLLQEVDGALEIGLFVDAAVLDNLAANDPAQALDDGNLADFLLALEGVSHFVYTVFCARRERPVSALELELQAEIDKYIICLLMIGDNRAVSSRLRRRLFEQFDLEPDLDAGERERYLVANENAMRYSASLERRFLAGRRLAEMLPELRRFYRMSLPAKFEHIQKAV